MLRVDRPTAFDMAAADMAEDEAGRGGFRGTLVRALSTGAMREILASTLLLIGTDSAKWGGQIQVESLKNANGCYNWARLM